MPVSEKGVRNIRQSPLMFGALCMRANRAMIGSFFNFLAVLVRRPPYEKRAGKASEIRSESTQRLRDSERSSGLSRAVSR